VAADARGRLWGSLRGLLPAGCHATRIENEIGSGFPDVHYTYLEVSGTIELKSAKRLPMGKDGLRQSQIDWINEEIEAGGLVWVIVQAGKSIFVLNGMLADEINGYGFKEMLAACTTFWLARAYEPGTLEAILLNKA
jgi:hypothetical protein